MAKMATRTYPSMGSTPYEMKVPQRPICGAFNTILECFIMRYVVRRLSLFSAYLILQKIFFCLENHEAIQVEGVM